MALSLSALVATLAIAAQFPPTSASALETTPSVTSTQAPLPYPFYPYPATITLAADSTGAPIASLSVLSQHNCGRRRDWLNTTTVDLRVPCLGATQLATQFGRGGCPLGGHRAPTEGTVQNTRTAFNFVCSPTPDAHPTPAPSDWKTQLPAPTLPAGFKPNFTPVSVTAASYVEGWCYQRVWLNPTDDGVSKRFCEQCATCVSPTSFTATVTTTVGVDCKPFQGRCTFMPLETGGFPTRCPSIEAENRASTVTANGAHTTWKYECAPTQTP